MAAVFPFLSWRDLRDISELGILDSHITSARKKAGVSAHLLDLTVDIESGDHAEKSRLPAGRRMSSIVKLPS